MFLYSCVYRSLRAVDLEGGKIVNVSYDAATSSSTKNLWLANANAVDVFGYVFRSSSSCYLLLTDL